MGKFKYLIRCISRMDFKNMFKVAKSISKKSKRSFIYIVFDILRSGVLYQAGYYDYQEFEFYNLNKEERKTYLTRGKNNQIIKTFNDKSFFHNFNNKIEFNKTFNKFLNRKWMHLNGTNLDEFLTFFKDCETIIVKPIDAEGGVGIEKYTYENESVCKALYQKLINNNQLLVEECIRQHSEMNKLFPSSVNTLRMFTFYKNRTSSFYAICFKNW